ncbi:RIP metalloprotease RseP [Pseudoroseicyclus tamaricis]|uniref:Zinc metalloprotease n=1 Tax=Pseudoroseicyclus tamaricis TaxID=2705421 RepID=A0A6B2JR05_9RHOB|nr:RIP metalloprotease RseP [Pseudoroseicyclus tamaricis]NDV00608.1 RIP metalloprotease RseP [Pseudoroseicyclus tamaricis]
MDLTQLLPQTGSVIFTLFFFLVAIVVIVTIHELGHYLVGRWCGIKADVFSVGFGPKLFSRRDKRGTVWQLAAVPLGGYVKFAGDADATSMGHADGAQRGRHTMLGAPLWARALTIAGGPFFNFFLAIAIFAAIFHSEGLPVSPLTVDRVAPLPESFQSELEPGDEVLAIGGVPVPQTPADYFQDLPDGDTLEYRVLRGGQQMTVTGPSLSPPIVGAVNPNSAAFAAGLEEGDVIVGVNGVEVRRFADLVETVGAGEGAPVQLEVWREGEGVQSLELTPRRTDVPSAGGGFETRWLIGIIAGEYFQPMTESPGPFQALGQAVSQLIFVLQTSLSGLWNVVTGAISSCNLSGPVTIAETSGQVASQGAMNFIWFLAIISAGIGMLNLLPVPVLDGGHLVFIGYEALAGRQPSEGALRVFTAIGLTLVMGLMIFALANDIFLCP